MNEKLKDCMLNNGLMAQRMYKHMNIVEWLIGFTITVYGILNTECVKEWIEVLCDKNC